MKLLLVCSLMAAPVLAADPSKVAADMRPIRKVITLLQEMKATAEKEAADDQAAYEKFSCWCTTNENEKTEATKIAEQRIADFSTAIEVNTAKAGQLKTDMAQLDTDIAEDKDALASATAIRERENEAYKVEEADVKETRQLLEEAIKTLERVQLLQNKNGAEGRAAQQAAEAALMQVGDRVKRNFPNFRGTMQRDLFDMLGSLQQPAQGFLPKHQELGLEQRSTTLLPWEKTEEQIGAEAKPNELEGAAANSKSYNSRSGHIVGILNEMHREFSRDLSSAMKEEFQALVSYQRLRAAKTSEIEIATKSKNAKEAQLAAALYTVAQAKADKESTEAALSADQKFLLNLQETCKNEDTEYEARQKVRSEEILALTETLKILTDDAARDLYGKTMSFIQLSHEGARADSKQIAAQTRAKEKSMKRLLTVAKRQGNWALASVAVRVGLDKFEKVKQVMDKMLAELQKQQKDEFNKVEKCKADIDKTEDDIKVGENTQEDLTEKHQQLENTIVTLNEEIDSLKQDVANMEVSLKDAGEQRKEQNALFQTSISDQRATINILNKALKRLRSFYGFAQVNEHGKQEPGAAAPPPPPKPSSKAYEKSGLSGGVLQMIMKIIRDAEATEKEMQVSEQHAQEAYASFVQDTSSSIQAARAAVQEKQGHVASAEGDKAETHGDMSSNAEELTTLGNLLNAHHTACDFVIKYFDVRQKARAEEMDAINDAKAILSGADFQ